MLAKILDCVGTVISNQTVCADMQSAYGESSSHLLRLHCPEIAQTARPGQFVMLDCGEAYNLRRPLSVHMVNGDEIIFYFVAWQGHGTEWLASRQPGDEISLLGPLGNGFTINAESQSLLLVGGGMGIAPLRFLAEGALIMGKTVTYAVGVRSTDLLAPDDLSSLKATCLLATEDGSGEGAHKGLVTELLPDYIDISDQVFICGPLPMYRAIARDRQRLLKNKPTQVSLEVRMGCGVGGCFSCSVRTTAGMRRVCKDGPVFNFDDILWDEVCL
jgi:dihydroorotate dehydrogenase electron transfer subunit